MNRGYVTAGEAGLIVYLVGMAVFVIALLLSAGKNADDHGGGNYADEQHIECDGQQRAGEIQVVLGHERHALFGSFALLGLLHQFGGHVFKFHMTQSFH